MSEREAFRVLIAAGGTGGHIFPALALADELCQQSLRTEVLFVGAVGGLEQQLVPARGYRLELLAGARKLKGSRFPTRLLALGRLPVATVAAGRLLRRFRPHVVVGLGGYVSAPVALSAAGLRIPVVLLEQNAIPGATNRLLARLARHVVVAFQGAVDYLPAGRALLLGNPLRPALLASLQQGRCAAPLEKRPPTLLVLGGSQGAHALNQLITDAVPTLSTLVPALQIHHQTGAADLEWVRERYQELGQPARVEPFIEEMGPAYNEATLVLGRAGATTLAELGAAGLPAVLIPYPYAADDHQAANAAELVQAGGAVMRRQEELDAGQLAHLLARLLGDASELERMSSAMRACGRPEAGAAIARLLAERFGPPEQK